MTARSRFCLALCAAAALAAPALAYVNGGDYHNTWKAEKKELTAAGYAVATGYHVESLDGLRHAANEEDVNRVVGLALKELPEKDAEKVPVRDKEEVARALAVALKASREKDGPCVKKGRAGVLEYQAGAAAYDAYWVTNYKGEGRRVHARRSGFLPFVALKLAGGKK